MSTRRAAAAEASKSQDPDDANGDVEMRDGADPASDVDSEGDTNDEGDEEEDEDEDPSRGLLRMIQDVSTYLCSYEEDGEELASGFQRIPNRRVLPDYFEVISQPIAFSTIRSKILRKQYTSFPEFVTDVAQICHNAQVYNRPSAPIFGAAVRLRDIFKQKLNELVAKGKVTSEEAELPDLGELPPVEDSPPPTGETDDEEDEDDEDEEEEDEEEDDDDDDSDHDGGRRRRGRRGRQFPSRQDLDDEAHKARGRPPSVLTPTEARISAILRGLRKPRDEDGSLLILPFEKLPDKAAVPDYYQTILNPVAMDHIKKKAKRKKYQHVDHAMADIERMFENAKLYNEDDSPLFKAAVELQLQARVLAMQEKARPDDDFRDEDGKLPLSEIVYNGEQWRVGDWVHIRNANDLGKPIVAQIYRTWQDREGQRWINACWYYRPEQTVHRVDKFFFEHEVVKTGQYRDHRIEDVLDRCFVMFITRFGRGRPRGFPPDKAIYVCESRYNEERFSFNKIKTWASCVPDEVRERDYEMDLFDVPYRMRKLPSPIKHLLREDAKETDDLPKPTWGSPNAPPIVGAVHRRPREPNDSPPPEPTPSAVPAPLVTENSFDAARRQAAAFPTAVPFPGDYQGLRGHHQAFAHAVPSPSPHHQFPVHMTSQFRPATPAGAGMAHIQQTPVPIPQPPHHAAPSPPVSMRPIHYQQQQPTYQAAPNFIQSPHMNHQVMQNQMVPQYNQGPPPAVQRPPMAQPPNNVMPNANMYNPPRPPEVYTLLDPVNDALPVELRKQFLHDGNGRVLFFTAPPLDRPSNGLSPESAKLGHSARYLAGRKDWLAERERKRKERDENNTEANKRLSLEEDDSRSPADESLSSQATSAIEKWFQDFDRNTQVWEKTTGLDGWRQPIQG
ncbi:unnamed protein product [Clonostachys rosea]|uniref:BAH domain-containing protein n=1 Tax=Bionectria ochroleuca TaxID=29856 RepID=A0ABY6UWG7_BIOOC|nr:unnamed protein product [Clonostachys rosea]